MAFVAWLTIAGMLVALLVVGFAWSCDKFERRLQSRAERRCYCDEETPRSVASARGGRLTVNVDPLPPSQIPVSSRPLREYPISLRGIIRPENFRRIRAWHGQ